jgi:hypothetical protein
MKNQKWRAVTIRPGVILPALSTDVPERDYAFWAFLQQWVVEAPNLHKNNENLPHYFEWDEVLSKLIADTDKLVPPLPPPPALQPGQTSPTPEQIQAAQAYGGLIKQRDTDLDKLRTGKVIYLTDEAFQAGLAASKAFLDEALEKKPQGNALVSTLHQSYGPRILRHYHALSQSPAVLESDIPKPEQPSTTPN